MEEKGTFLFRKNVVVNIKNLKMFCYVNYLPNSW